MNDTIVKTENGFYVIPEKVFESSARSGKDGTELLIAKALKLID